MDSKKNQYAYIAIDLVIFLLLLATTNFWVAFIVSCIVGYELMYLDPLTKKG